MEYIFNDFNDMQPSYADLPMEIIVQIFRYLNFCDIQAAALTCHRWLEATEYFEFKSRVLVRFTKSCIPERISPGRIFMRTTRYFPNLYLDETVYETLTDFFSRIESVVFDTVEFNDKYLCTILKEMTELNDLTIMNCSSLFMSGQFLRTPNDRESIADTMANVKSLSLKHNQYLSDAILLRLTSLVFDLVRLDLSGCHIAYHSAIQRRFYPEELANNPSESILTFKFLLDVIQSHAGSLKELNLSQTLIGSPAMNALSAIPTLSLDKLEVTACRQLNATGLSGFIESQKTLKYLNISDCLGVTDMCIETIADCLPLLEFLNVHHCNKITNKGAAALVKLKKLTSLILSNCNGITSEGIISGIAKSKNDTLLELYVSHLDLGEECIIQCAENLINLQVFDTSCCINGITNKSVQAIIKNLPLLRELNLENCDVITDVALTGIDVGKQLSSVNSSYNSSVNSEQYFQEIPSPSLRNNGKISLRSKAEEEIVQDAIRKQALLAIHEMNLIDDSTQDGYSIRELKGLLSLNLRGCNKITDVSLKYGIKLLELRSLLLSNCQQISIVGIETLVKNCPSIEELDLSDCYNINDKTIEIITRRLRRLKVLNLSGCTQLTDHTLNSIAVNCKVLHTLSIYRCRRMCSDIELRLSNITSLHTINMDRSNTMDNADIFRLKKRMDY